MFKEFDFGMMNGVGRMFLLTNFLTFICLAGERMLMLLKIFRLWVVLLFGIYAFAEIWLRERDFKPY